MFIGGIESPECAEARRMDGMIRAVPYEASKAQGFQSIIVLDKFVKRAYNNCGTRGRQQAAVPACNRWEMIQCLLSL